RVPHCATAGGQCMAVAYTDHCIISVNVCRCCAGVDRYGYRFEFFSEILTTILPGKAYKVGVRTFSRTKPCDSQYACLINRITNTAVAISIIDKCSLVAI